MADTKFRFSELTGNQLNISLLKRSIGNNTFRQFTIFNGVFGTGKSTCAKISAMALTCENSCDGEPCCICNTCKENMKAFSLGMDSPFITTVNAGMVTTRDDVKELIHNIFDLKGSVRNKIFIIEEAHALSKVQNAQTVFLSELDNMPANVYVMFSTTRMFELSEELKSRAEIYTFGRLSDTESKALLNSAAEQRNFGIPDSILNLIVKEGRGVPRNLLKALDFTIDEQVNLSELRAHLQTVDDSQLVGLFESMLSPQIQVYADILDTIRCSVGVQEILLSVKSFLVQVAFLIEGNISGTFNSDDTKTIKNVFTRDKFYKIVKLFNGTAKKVTDSDFDLLMLQVRMIMQGRGTADVLLDSRKVGAVEKESADEIKVETTKSFSTAQVQKITLGTVRKYQDGN